MSIKHYIEDCDRTLNKEYPFDKKEMEERLTVSHLLIGLQTETGELGDCFKKFIFYNQDLDVDNAIEELGDILFYYMNVITFLNKKLKQIDEKSQPFTLDDIISYNMVKRTKRYPKGFSFKDAKERKDKIEE